MKQMSNLQLFRDEKKELFETLTDREVEVLAHIASGMKNPVIAKELEISRATVQNHRANIRDKLNVKNQVDFVKYAMAFDLVKL